MTAPGPTICVNFEFEIKNVLGTACASRAISELLGAVAGAARLGPLVAVGAGRAACAAVAQAQHVRFVRTFVHTRFAVFTAASSISDGQRASSDVCARLGLSSSLLPSRAVPAPHTDTRPHEPHAAGHAVTARPPRLGSSSRSSLRRRQTSKRRFVRRRASPASRPTAPAPAARARR